MKQVISIAVNTFREAIRSKILYTVLFFLAALLAMSAFFGSVTIGDKIKVIKDFGLFGLSIATVIFAVMAGATLLQKELVKKTIYNILSKPVARYQFLLGKYFGLLSTALVLLVLMAAGLSLFVRLFENQFDWYLLLAYLYFALELLIVCAAAIFFSSIVVTPLLSGLFTFAFFLAGRSTEYVLYFIKEGEATEFTAKILKSLYWVLPHFQDLNVANFVVNGVTQAFTLERFLLSGIYAFCYSTILLLIATAFFAKRDFN